MLIEQAEIKIILPEGVTDLQLDTPFPISRGEDKKHFTYLDTTGRTVVVLSTGPGQLMTEAHIQDFQLQFTYPRRTMLAEPFLLVFLLAIVYVRLDFSITVDAGAEAKMKVN